MNLRPLFFAITAGVVSTTSALADELRPDEMADLSVVSIKADPEFPKPGETVAVELTVRNNATHDQPHVPVVLFSGTERAREISADFKAGETRHLALSWRATAGDHLLSGRVDPDAALSTTDRSDDGLEIPIAVAAATARGTDIVVGPIAVETDGATQGRTATISVRNAGTAAADVPVEIRIDGVVNRRQLVTLDPGQADTITLVLPEDAASLTAIANPRDRTLEQSAANNEVTRDLRQAVAPRIDRVSFAPIRPAAGVAPRGVLSFRVTNAGAQDLRRSLAVTLSAGERERSAGGNQVTVPPLASGESIYLSRVIDAPTAGTGLRIALDPDHFITWLFGPAPVGQWLPIGPTRIENGGLGAVGRLSAIAMNRGVPDTIYVGAAQAGVWKTEDAGASWWPVADSLPTLKIAALAIAPTQASTIYVATADAGVFRSDDAGGSWRALANSPNGEVRWGVLIVSPRDPGILFMNAADGVHRSTDGGANWSRVLAAGQATDLVMASPTTLFAAISGDGVYKTTDGGSNWVRLAGLPRPNPGFQITLAVARGAPSSLYAGLNMPGGLQLFRSDDAGQSWSRKNTPADTTLYNDVIGVDPVDPDVVYVTGVNFWRSTDGGVSYTKASGPHADHHAFLNDPVANQTIYALSDGGIFKSTNRGQDWRFIGAGLANVEFYDHGLAATDPVLDFGGTQDNGTLRYSGTMTWKEILGGDGATVAIDPTDANIVYAMNQGADSVQRASNGSSFQGFASGLPTGSVCNNLAFFIHPRTRTTLIAPCQGLWRTTSTNPPGDWQQILAAPTPAVIVRAAVDPTTDLYFAGTSDGRIMAGPGGANWGQIFAHMSGAAVADMDVDPAGPRALFVAFNSGSGADRIERLTRSTAGWTAQGIADGLPPGIVVQSLAIDPALDFTLYAGTKKGVYRGRAASAAGPWFWSLYSNGLPLADARDLEVHPKTGLLRLATYGRSAYEVNTVDPIGSVLGAEGRITMLRAHDVGTGYGPPNDVLDVEAVLWLDTKPGQSFGFQLRKDANQSAAQGMFGLLRKAFAANRPVRIDYIRTGLRSGRIVRVMLAP